MAKPLWPALKVTLLLFSLVCVFPASAQVFPLADIEAYIQRGMKDWNVPGLAIGVVKDGQVILEKGYGVREIGKDGPVDKNTVFAIGSTSKAFTSLAVGLLVQDGRISWDDPVIKHMPAFQLYDPWVTREITPRDLLSNRSGLGDDTEFLWYGTDYDRNEIVRRLR